MGIAAIRYNAGNIRSVDYALKRLGVGVVIISDKGVLRAADKVIFPGVGEAETIMLHPKENSMDHFIKELRQPVLGICLDTQLICRFSGEGSVGCLGIFSTDVERSVSRKHKDKASHTGWSTIDQLKSGLFKEFIHDKLAYSVHSYYTPASELTATGIGHIRPFSAALYKDNFYVTQLYPEEDGVAGERVIGNFLGL